MHIIMFITFLRYIWFNIMLIIRKITVSTMQKRNHHNNNIKESTELSVISKNIPTVQCLPLIGTLLDFIAAGGAPQLHIYVQRRHEQYGPIFRERLGGPGAPEMIFIASASLMRRVFLYEGRHPRHPLPDAWTLYNREHNCQRGLFFMDGSEWFHNRRILNRFMLNSSLNWMNERVDQCSKQVVRLWHEAIQKSTDGVYQVINLESCLYRWAIDVVISIMFDVKLPNSEKLDELISDFARNVHKIFESSSALMSLPPQLAKMLRMRQWTEFEKNVSSVLSKGAILIEVLLQLTATKIDTSDVGQSSECSEASLSNDDAAPLSIKLLNDGMPLDMVKRIFIDLIIAAGDTTAYTSEWALYLLSRSKPLQNDIRQEISLAQSSTDDGRFELVNGLIKETLRLYPAAPFIGRYLAMNATLGGYPVKKDTLVLLSLYTAGRQAHHFKDPFEVMPHRWQRNNQTNELRGVLEPHASLPFAIGNRSCIGRKLAMKQMHSLLVSIIASFELDCCNITEIESVLRMVTVPSQPLQLRIRLVEQQHRELETN